MSESDDDDKYYPYKLPEYKSNNKIDANIENLIQKDKLSNKIKISTITMSCEIGTTILLHNVARFVTLHPDRIVKVEYGLHPLNNRTLIKNEKKKKKKKKKNFYNEMTVKINVGDDKVINMKLFKNGSLQLTGIKSMKIFNEVISKLFFELLTNHAVVRNMKLIKKPFLDHPENLKLQNVKICMINTNFKVDHKLDRDSLYTMLLKDKISCTYDPCNHPSVIIKYKYSNNKDISIFVFQSGSIIITGSTTVEQIMKSYNFIVGKLRKYGNAIISLKIEDLLSKKELNKYLK